MEKEIYFDSPEALKKYKVKNIFSQIGLYTFLVAVAIFILIPFYWMLISSVKSSAEIQAFPPTLFPNSFDLSSYVEVLTGSKNFLRYFGNTILVSVLTTSLVIITSVFAAFAFARLNFKGKELIFGALLMTMMIPGEMMVITNYMTISSLGWMKTYQALILPFAVSVFYIFFLRQNFQQIPNELYLAAKVDGVSDFKYLFRVMIPICMPTIVTVIILSMMGTWNAYVWPQLVANSEDMMMVANGLMNFLSSKNDTMMNMENLQLAGAAVVTLPLLIFFVIFRKYIMRGVSRSGIKG